MRLIARVQCGGVKFCATTVQITANYALDHRICVITGPSGSLGAEIQTACTTQGQLGNHVPTSIQAARRKHASTTQLRAQSPTTAGGSTIAEQRLTAIPDIAKTFVGSTPAVLTAALSRVTGAATAGLATLCGLRRRRRGHVQC